MHPLLGALSVEQRIEVAAEVAVQALVARDEFVGEGEPGHEAALLEPEDGAEAARRREGECTDQKRENEVVRMR